MGRRQVVDVMPFRWIGLLKEAFFSGQFLFIAAPCIIVFVLLNQMVGAIDGSFKSGFLVNYLY